MARATLGVIVGNRDFFPDALVTEARADILALFAEMDLEAVLVDDQATKLGGVETRAEVGSAPPRPASAIIEPVALNPLSRRPRRSFASCFSMAAPPRRRRQGPGLHAARVPAGQACARRRADRARCAEDPRRSRGAG